MDLLASIIGGGPAVVDVTVNGMPLSQLVTQIAATLKDQQDQIATLRDYTYKNDEAMWSRVQTLEHGVSRLNRDLGFAQREEQGALEAKPTHAAIAQLEKQVHVLDLKRRGMVVQQTQDWNAKRLMLQRFHTWINVAKRNGLLRTMLGSNTREVQRRYMKKWLLMRATAKKQRARSAALAVLMRFNNNRLLRSYYERLQQWRSFSLRYRAERHVALVRAVEAMQAVSLRGFLRRKWLQWMQVVARRRLREDQKRAALRMAALSSRQLVRRYFATWLALEGQHNLRRRQMRTATALAVQSARILAGRAFDHWVAVGRRKKQRRTGAALIPRMAHDQSVRLASRYYIKLWRNAMARRDERSRSQLEDMTRDLTRRFENLSGQVSGTMNQTQETVTALQKLSKQQEAFEQRTLQQQPAAPTTTTMQYAPSSASGIVRQATPPGRRPSPPVRGANNNNLQQLADQRSPVLPASTAAAAGGPARPPPTGPVGDSRPSGNAMQLGSQVSQISLRGGGSGEVTRVRGASTNSRSGSLQGAAAPAQQQQQGGGGLPAQWLESPDAAWSAIREKLQQQGAAGGSSGLGRR